VNRFSLWSVLVLFVLVFVIGCGGKTTSVEGKVVDGKGQPLAKVRVAAKMSQPLKGYDFFSTTTGADGSFKFGKLFPTSEYRIFLFSKRSAVEEQIKTYSGPEGQTKILPELTMRFVFPEEGVILDTLKNMMWAANDKGADINWANAKSYCENYRGGGYTDWRMPTSAELAELNESGEIHMNYNGISVWASETRGSQAAIFLLNNGKDWKPQSEVEKHKAFPVRSIK